ncbi:uncharacterized protein EI90DRAFT_3050388 [Cantharellus anzutake]|uniref:uncharacterized protein n=1 Tax=Cantharellus anzutake TaxID=1750568 RepID=UPI0019086AFB|nr:uncharacterized protein EI90DRAFT_3050388 [Cantharellus anzutake]KAF8333947.1 hypothetical protein EI90DRAFT_3050388 [Cantharellus anzutake]
MSTSIPRIGSPFPQDSPLSSRPPPRTQDSDGSDVLLPYDREGSPEFEKPPAPAPTSTLLPPPRKDSITFPSNRNRRSDTTGSSSSYTSPSHPDDDRTSVSSSSGPQKINRDTIVTSSIYSTASNDTRTPRYSKSMGALNRSAPRQLMDTLTEEDVSPTTSRVVDPSSVPIAESAKPPSSTEPLKIPSRSMTTPARTNAPTTRRKRTVRACIRCQKKIEDGRWVAVDQGDGGVLCEKDWKDMYLPKCRRCGLTIESHAVSSADGQLKGKYHRHCFNCSTCQKPFPDRSFYVFGGQPFCDYHYHQANNSLCCNSTCGKPIEGPCAEDHEGRRYHPNHLVCSEAGCEERLEDYYDVEGFKYCEKHYFESHRDGVQTDDIHVESRSSSPQGPGRVSVPGTPKKDESPSMLSTPRGTPDSRATKRRTRLIALDPARRI